nr:mediator of RNA polymerase II transcription subunit 14-like isoform X1 [Tanacetum cinerariifolium]
MHFGADRFLFSSFMDARERYIRENNFDGILIPFFLSSSLSSWLITTMLLWVMGFLAFSGVDTSLSFSETSFQRRRVRGFATLGYRGYLTMFRIFNLEVLVGETSGPVKLEKMRRFVLGDDLECMMAASEILFTTLYTILNEFCGQDISASPVQTCQDGEANCNTLNFQATLAEGTIGVTS